MEDDTEKRAAIETKVNAMLTDLLTNDGFKAVVCILLTKKNRLVVVEQAERRPIAYSMAYFATNFLDRPPMPEKMEFANLDQLLENFPEEERAEMEAHIRREFAKGMNPSMRHVLALKEDTKECPICHGPLRRIGAGTGEVRSFQNPDFETTKDYECDDCGAIFQTCLGKDDA
jgi:hypothetical protein